MQLLTRLFPRIVALCIALCQIATTHELSRSKKAVNSSKTDNFNPCPPGYYGETCASVCPWGCSQACDLHGLCLKCSNLGVQLPHCTKQCPKGTYGLHCGLQCSSACRDLNCDPQTGECLSCAVAGFQLPTCTSPCLSGTFDLHCKKQCPLACKEKCDPVSGACRECEYGEGVQCTVNCARSHFLQACRLYCPERCLTWCNTTNGACSLCAPGYRSPHCELPCLDGSYGHNCEKKCSVRCQNRSCDPVDGLCYACSIGYVGRRCNGHCIPGLYGQDCLLSCPETCADSLCHFVTGNCIKCLPGYTGRMCEQLCEDGMYSENCKLACPSTCQNKCDAVTGECWHCAPGYVGIFCNVTCKTGTYGPQCGNLCPQGCLNNVCHPVSGVCESCKDAYHGKLCDEEKAVNSVRTRQEAMALYIIISLLVPMVVLGVVMLCYKRKFKRNVFRLARPMERMKLNTAVADDAGAGNILDSTYRSIQDLDMSSPNRSIHSSQSEGKLVEHFDTIQTPESDHFLNQYRQEITRQFPNTSQHDGGSKQSRKWLATKKEAHSNEKHRGRIEAVLSELKIRQKDETAKVSLTLLENYPKFMANEIDTSPPLSSAMSRTVATEHSAALIDDRYKENFQEVSSLPLTNCMMSGILIRDYVNLEEPRGKHEKEQPITAVREDNARDTCDVQPLMPSTVPDSLIAGSELLQNASMKTLMSTVYSLIVPPSPPTGQSEMPPDVTIKQSIKCEHSSPRAKIEDFDTLFSPASHDFTPRAIPTIRNSEYHSLLHVHTSLHSGSCHSSSSSKHLYGSKQSDSQISVNSVTDIIFKNKPDVEGGKDVTVQSSSTASTTGPIVHSRMVQKSLSSGTTEITTPSGKEMPTFATISLLSQTNINEADETLNINSALMEDKSHSLESPRQLGMNRQFKYSKHYTSLEEKRPVKRLKNSSNVLHIIDGTERAHRGHSSSRRDAAVSLDIEPKKSVNSCDLCERCGYDSLGLVDTNDLDSNQYESLSLTDITDFQSHSGQVSTTDEPVSPASKPIVPPQTPPLKSPRKVTPKSCKSDTLNQETANTAYISTSEVTANQSKMYCNVSPPKSTSTVKLRCSSSTSESESPAASKYSHQEVQSERETIHGFRPSTDLEVSESFIKPPAPSASGMQPSSPWTTKTESLSPMLMRCSTTRQVSPMCKPFPPSSSRLQPLPTPPPEGRSALKPVKKGSVSSIFSSGSLAPATKPADESEQ